MADTSRVDHIVAEAFHKSAGLVLGARLTASPEGSRSLRSRRTPNKWFNLEISELECVAEDFAPWRRGNTQATLIIQVVLQSRDAATPGQEQPAEQVLEEWTLEYKPSTPMWESPNIGTGVMSRRQAAYQDTHSIYKRLVIFHRSLYAYLRMLPGFKIFKALKRNANAPYDIVCRILPQATAFCDTASTFRFGAIETPAASFQVSVAHATDIQVPNLEVQPSLPTQANVITDYIKQPTTSAPPCRDGRAQLAPRQFQRSSSLPQQPRWSEPPQDALPPDPAAVEGSTPPCRHSWASNPVKVAAPKWSCAPDFHPSTGNPPSLIPKATPWSLAAQQQQGNRPQPIASPTSTLSLPASYPSRMQSPASGVSASPASGPAAAPSPDIPSSAPGPARRHTTGLSSPKTAEAAPSQSRTIDHRSGFVLPSSEALPELKPAKMPPVRLAQGGITAAVAAGQMEPLKGKEGAEGADALPHGGREARQVHTTAGGSDDDESGARTRSSPMCIPGAALPRNQSLSQLPQGRKSQDAKRAERLPVLSAPEVKVAAMHAEPAAIAGPLVPMLKDALLGSDATRVAHPSVQPDCPAELPCLPVSSEASHCSDSSASHFQMSCSPQLPFAFTPASVSHSLMQKAGGELMAARAKGRFTSPGDQVVPGMVMGRDVSDLALIRRSSWSTKSFSQSELPWLGPSAYSFSPSPSTDPCIVGTSAHSSHHLSGMTGMSPASESNHYLGHGPLSIVAPLDDEDDSLPFALEDYGGECSRQESPSSEPPALGGLGCSMSASLDSDAAVGALARMLQEAPPLRSAAQENPPGPQLELLLADVDSLKHHIAMCRASLDV
mmetsp:Transcript_13350/g.34615  ORF Transcript_13350/g.34615 Transcript_13350/m.34615 type:complete len:837 (+) Transcript_13350:169-2679(+)